MSKAVLLAVSGNLSYLWTLSLGTYFLPEFTDALKFACTLPALLALLLTYSLVSYEQENEELKAEAALKAREKQRQQNATMGLFAHRLAAIVDNILMAQFMKYGKWHVITPQQFSIHYEQWRRHCAMQHEWRKM